MDEGEKDDQGIEERRTESFPTLNAKRRVEWVNGGLQTTNCKMFRRKAEMCVATEMTEAEV